MGHTILTMTFTTCGRHASSERSENGSHWNQNLGGGVKRLAKRCKRRRPTEQATQSSKGSEYKRRWNRAKHQLDRSVVEKQKGKGAPLTVLWGNPAKASVAKIQEKQAVDEPLTSPLAL